MRMMLLMLMFLPCLVMAQTPRDAPARAPTPRVPGASTTHHSLALAGGKLDFTAVVAPVVLNNAAGAAQAVLMTTAYVADGSATETRPVMFAFNGGPGAASVWLDLGLAGPWRMPMEGEAGYPSAAVAPVENLGTWLAFTDLVFIDPPGTGYARLLNEDEATKKRFWSVSGDVDAIAETIHRWLVANHRLASPKYVVGESYGGIRGPRVVRTLLEDYAVGVRGLVLISPLMDYSEGAVIDPLLWAGLLPSETAAARARKGPVSRADLADVEAYAGGDYIADLLKGEADPAAVARVVAKVTEFTGLDAGLVAARRGMVPKFEVLREHDRASRMVDSYYDLSVSRPDAHPEWLGNGNPDPIADSLAGPMGAAMAVIYDRRLNFHAEEAYVVDARTARRQWDFGRPLSAPQSFSHLRFALAMDPGLHVLISHGLFDVQTPYFRTQLLLNTIPASAGRDRVGFIVLPGGHMHYMREASRVALTAAVRELVGR